MAKRIWLSIATIAALTVAGQALAQTSATQLARNNLRIRLNSLDNIGPAGLSTTAPRTDTATTPSETAHPPLQKFGATYTWDGAKYVRQ